MLLVDDHSRWMQVYVLQSKDQVCDAFVKYKAEVENVTGCRVKTLKSDRGGELLAGVFARVCEQAGIKRQFIAPYTPQQNEVVERRNRTVMEMAGALLKSMKILGRYWGEAVRYAVYLLNRLPTKKLGDSTPFEAWSGRKPSLGHLRVFGCVGHARSVTPHLKKLDARANSWSTLEFRKGVKHTECLILKPTELLSVGMLCLKKGKCVIGNQLWVKILHMRSWLKVSLKMTMLIMGSMV